MDEFISNALKRKAEIEAELAAINDLLEAYERYIRTGWTDAISSKMAKAEKTPVDKSAVHEGIRTKNRGLPAVIAETVESVIRERNEPMNRTELVEALEDRGIEMPAADKPRYIGTILWRHKDRFENIPGRGYWLVGLPVPDQHGGLI